MADEDIGLQIPISLDLSGLKQGLSDMKDKVSANLENVKAAFGAVGIAAAGYLKGAVESAAKAEVSTARLKQQIENQGESWDKASKQVSQFTSGIMKLSTYSGGDAKAALTELTTKGVKLNDALKMQNTLVDLAAGKNIDLTQASDILADAYNGKTRALISLGLATKDEIKNGISFAEVQDRINQRFGGSAASQLNTYDGQMKQFTNTMNSFKTQIGQFILPYFEKLARHLNELAQRLNSLSPGVKEIIAKVLGLTAVFGTLIGGVSLFSKVSSLLGPVVSGIGGALGGLTLPIVGVIAAIAGLALAYTKNFGGLKTFIDGVFGKISGAINTGMEAFNKYHSVLGALNAGLSKLFGGDMAAKILKPIWAIQDGIKIFVSVLKGDTSQAKDLLATGFGIEGSKANKIIQTIQNVKFIITNTVSAIKQHIKELQPIFTTVFNIIGQIINNVFVPAFKLVIQIVSSVINFIKTHWKEINAVISGVINTLVFIFKNILAPVLQFIIQIIGQVITWVQQNWPLIEKTISTVMNAISSVVKPILSAIAEFWKEHGQTIMKVVGDAFDIVKTIISTVLNTVMGIIKFVMQLITGDWSGAWNTLVDTVSNIFSGIGKIISDILDGVGKIFTDIADTAIKWGENMINGFINGIKNVGHKVSDAAHDVIKGVADFLGFHSPSKKGEGQHIVEWGQNMVKGFMSGIQSQIPAMQRLMDTAIKAPNLQGSINMSSFGTVSLAGAAGGMTTIVVPVNIDGKQTAKVIAPYSDKTQGSSNKFRQRGYGVK